MILLREILNRFVYSWSMSLNCFCSEKQQIFLESFLKKTCYCLLVLRMVVIISYVAGYLFSCKMQAFSSSSIMIIIAQISMSILKKYLYKRWFSANKIFPL